MVNLPDMPNSNARVVRVTGDDLDNVARRRNELIVSKYRLSLQAQRLFLYVVSMVDDDHDERTTYEFSIYELAKKIGVDRNHLYGSMVEILNELASTYVYVAPIEEGQEVENGFVRCGLIVNKQRVRIEGGRPKLDEDGKERVSGEITIALHKELLPYVRQLNERYTSTALKYVFRLESSYSQKLYDILKSKAFAGRAWRVSREELYEMLVVRPDQLFAYFRREILERAQREINAHTDIAFEYEFVNKGKRVVEVVFHMKEKGGERVQSLPGTMQHTVLKGLMELGLKAKQAEALIAEWWEVDPERLRWHLAEARRRKASGKAKNPLAWFRAGLKADYRPQGSLFGRKVAADDKAELEKEKKMRERARRELERGGEKPVVAMDKALQEALLRLGERVQTAKTDK
jgi:plasmid replication initiation protein